MNKRLTLSSCEVCAEKDFKPNYWVILFTIVLLTFIFMYKYLYIFLVCNFFLILGDQESGDRT